MSVKGFRRRTVDSSGSIPLYEPQAQNAPSKARSNVIPLFARPTQWLAGWKFANVYIAEDTLQITFAPLRYDELRNSYGVNGTAKCHTRLHAKPDENCSCGFSAWERKKAASRWHRQGLWKFYPGLYNNDCIVQLRVGLYGDVVEAPIDLAGEQMLQYRASQQTVVDLFFATVCSEPDCTEETDMLGLTRHNDLFGWALQPLCRRHIWLTKIPVSLDEIEAANNIAVHWGYASE